MAILGPLPTEVRPTYLIGQARGEAVETIKRHHYTHSVPSGKSFYLACGPAIVVWSIPANKNIAPFLLGRPGEVWELARLWAPDHHKADLLTQAISQAVRWLKHTVPDLDCCVSYADPNVGHLGGVYRAASWIYSGQVEEGRYYQVGNQVVSRRKFHSGGRSMTKAEILATGATELKRPGRHRFVKPVSRYAKNRWSAYAKSD